MCCSSRAVKVIRRHAHERTIEKTIHTYKYIYIADLHRTLLIDANNNNNNNNTIAYITV